tara:strand:- start:1258 stop:1815 length:558 start_codon:yes stop_codon:yes gene_type:complete
MDYLKVYTDLFDTKDYSVHDENTYRYQLVKSYIEDHNPESMIDIGSGRGKLLSLINDSYDIKIESSDLDKFHNINIPFRHLDLSNKSTYFNDTKYDILTCLDVLEHLDKSFLKDSIKWFKSISNVQILTIANHSEILNGIEIHTIQEDENFWREHLIENSEILQENIQVFGSRNYLYTFILKNKI